MASGDEALHPPECKKRKVKTDDKEHNKIFNTFFNEYTEYDLFMNKFETLLCSAGHALLPSIISSCDADCPTFYGRPFHECECIANADASKAFHFGAFFIHGTKIFDSLKSKAIPENRIYRAVASRLLQYVLQEKAQWEGVSLKQKKPLGSLFTYTMNLKSHEFEWLLNHLGHTGDVHKQHYTHMSGLLKGVYISKLLLVQDMNLTAKFANQDLREMDIRDWHEELKKLVDISYVLGETQVMVTLAEHFFSRLTMPRGYIMNKYANKTYICRCGKCERESLRFDDTSIGNNKIWHGTLDILFESCDVAVSCPFADVDESEDDSPGGRSCVEMKRIENLDNIQPRSQVIAQTIVFSLLQKQRHPSSEHFLIPNIIANAKTLKFFFYDAENDILLESKKYDFVWEESGNLPACLRLETTIAVWLVLNHKLLCTGPYPEFLHKAPKSLFKTFAKDSLETYEHHLKLRNVLKRDLPGRAFSNWERIADENPDGFVWPSSLHRPNFDKKVFGESSADL